MNSLQSSTSSLRLAEILSGQAPAMNGSDILRKVQAAQEALDAQAPAASRLPTSVHSRLTTLVPLLLPTLVFGQVAVVATILLLGTTLSSLVVFGACLAGVTFSSLVAYRQANRATQGLRRPELRPLLEQESGLFRDIVVEANQLVATAEAQTATALHAKAMLEARLHVLRKQSRRLELALQEIEQPVVMVDHNSRPIFRNEAANQLCRRVNPAAPPGAEAETPENLMTMLHSTLARRAASDRRSAEFRWPVGPGEENYRAVLRNLYDVDAACLGAVATLRDIRVETQERSRHAEFVSSVCHEFKTPMASIKAYAELLMDGDIQDADQQTEVLTFIDAQVERLTRLVNNMLNLSRIESGVIRLHRQDVELNKVLKGALEVIVPTAAEKSIRVVSELSELYIPVYVDQDLFSQAVINLLSNAVKYTPDGGEVTLRSRMDETHAIVEIRDTGMGIPADSLPKLFQRFYRVPENVHAAAGTGLGLALVKYIVTSMHDGSVTVASEPGAGSCFTVSIPLGHQTRGPRRGTDNVLDDL